LTAFDFIGNNQRFGWSVSLSEDVAVVGATHDNGMMGAAYVFRYDGEAWLEEAKLTGSEPVGIPFFGSSVSLSPDTNVIVVGARSDFALGFESGAAYVFRHDGGAWNEMAKLTASDGGPGGIFGVSVSVYDDRALIGGPGQSEDQGSAYCFVGLSGVDCNDNSVSDACDIFDQTSEDANGNGIPDECEAAGDLNGDGVVNVVGGAMVPRSHRREGR
jgi:hypothetical protein